MSFQAPQTYMAHALRLAQRGLYTTDPNPRVGCVLVKDRQVIAEGWHQRAGGAHAEAVALQQAGAAARGATAYVTLEPCCHHGRTPPCSQALIRAGVAKVVVAMPDPNPQVAGQGIVELEAAGITVESGVLQAQAEALNAGFIKRMRHGRPWVRVKLAMGVDGRTAMASGESQWITGASARADVHHWRARSTAVLTGIGTVLADDPALTARVEGAGEVLQPWRVVLDSRLRMPTTARMLSLPGKTVVLTSVDDAARAVALRAAGADVVVLPAGAQGLELGAVLNYLGAQGVNELHVEAGAAVSGALVREGLVDQLLIYMAPVLMGDAARPLLHLPGLSAMSERLQLVIEDMRAVGDDWRITARLR